MKGVSFFGVIAPMIALFIAIVWAGVAIVAKNINAKDLVFSFTALAAAFVMFSLNLFFSLKNKEQEHIIQPHLTISQDCVDVYSTLGTKSGFVVINRKDLSSCLSLVGTSQNFALPSLSQSERKLFNERLIEFLRVSLVGHLLSEYPDWNPKVKSFRGSKHVQFNNSKEGAGKNSYYSIEELVTSLNFKLPKFEKFKGVIASGLTLPPNTKFFSVNNNLIFDNPYILIKINFEIEDRMSLASPSYDGSVLKLDMRDTNKNITNIQSNIRINILFKKQRHKNNYESWASQIVSTIESGFSPV